jgi:hypothetical protein
MVKDSVHIWPSIGKAHVKKTDHDAATVWNNVPEEIREANVMATRLPWELQFQGIRRSI